MTWDPDADALSCEYCGARIVVPRDEGTIVERPLAEAGSAAKGLGLEVRVARCGTCGARITFGESSTAEVCVYCGDARVLEQSANRNALRPESLVPLNVGRANVEKEFRRWLGKLWFRPSALKKQARFDAVGVYVPFWTYDCRVHSRWSADAGYYYWVPVTHVVMVNGKPQVRTRMERRVRWEPAWGERDDAFDDLLVCASGGLSGELIGEVGAFDTAALVPYRPEYLAGWRAEEYAVDLEQGWERASAMVEAAQRERCAGDVPGDTHRNLRVHNSVADVHWKHALLPLWSLQYRWHGKTYTVLINGQTGHVAGRAPYSWGKIALAVLFGLLVLAVLLGLLAVL
jgi:DNA-directed RNA polymerase subunit RPC12/RpoP